MSNFGVKRVLEEIGYRTPIYALTKSDYCEYEDFINKTKAEVKYNGELKSIYGHLETIGSGKFPPANKCRKLEGFPGNFQPWEIRTKNLRLFFFYDHGLIIICGGKKANQKKDINYLKKLEKDIPRDVHQTRITGGS